MEIHSVAIYFNKLSCALPFLDRINSGNGIEKWGASVSALWIAVMVVYWVLCN